MLSPLNKTITQKDFLGKNRVFKSSNHSSFLNFCTKMGRKKLAIKYYKKSLELNPNNKNAELILKELE